MSIDDRIASDQPKSFKFTAENEREIKRIIAKYPKGRQASAVMPLLDLAQRQHDNWIPCLLYTSPSPRDRTRSRMPSSA